MGKIMPAVEVELLPMDDPEFEGGATKTAQAVITNPTAKAWTYDLELYLGILKAATSGVGQVTVPANSAVTANFTIVMPTTEGTYEVYLDVVVAAELLKHYRATEDVVISISPAVDVGPITWA